MRAPTFRPFPTPSQRRVLKLLACGLSNQAIADDLEIHRNTVKGHLQRLSIKAGATSRTQLLIFALKRGWVKIEREIIP